MTLDPRDLAGRWVLVALACLALAWLVPPEARALISALKNDEVRW